MNDKQGYMQGEGYSLPSGSGYELTPYEEEEFEQEVPLEDIVEGEFREVPERPTVSARPTGSGPSMQDLRAKREAARTASELAETEKRAKLSQAELEILRAERARVELGKAKRESRVAGVREVSGYAGKIASVFSPSLGKKEKADLYFGKAKGSLYVPSTPTTSFLEEIPAKQLHKPHLEKLRRAGSPATGVTTRVSGMVTPPMARSGQSPLNYGFLREAGRLQSSGPLGQLVAGQLQGGSRLEQLIFAAIQENQDADSLEHIKAEMERLGYQKGDVEQALRNLQSQGFVEKQGQIYEIGR